jgi:hypothetical protein
MASYLKDIFGTGTNIFGQSAGGETDLLVKNGLLSQEQVEKAQNASLISGLIGTGLSYAAQPKNQDYGSFVPYLAKGFQQGMEQAKQPFTDLRSTANSAMKMEDYALQKQTRERTARSRALMDKIRNPDGTINVEVLKQLRAEDPKAFLQYQELELNDAKINKLYSEAEENRGEIANAGAIDNETRMKYADKYTQASMENAMRTGDMSLLVPLKENKNRDDVLAEYARIKNEYGEAEANNFINSVSNGGQRSQGFDSLTEREGYRVQAKPAVQNTNYNYTDANGVTRTPIIFDTTQPQKVINEMRQLKPSVDKAFKSNQLLLRNARNGIRRLLATGSLGRITGVPGQFFNIPGGKAADAENELKGIKEKEFLNNYQRIKAAGGGFGSLTEKEGERLENMRAVLSQDQSPEQMERTLIRLEKELAKYEELDREEYYQTYGDKDKFELNALTQYESSTPNADSLGLSGGSGIPSDAEVDAILGL